MHLTYEGQEWTFDLEEITLQQARTIKSSCNLTLLGLEEGLEGGDPDALRAVFWLMQCQNSPNEKPDIDRVDFKIVKFAKALDAAGKAEAPADEDPKDEASSSQA